MTQTNNLQELTGMSGGDYHAQFHQKETPVVSWTEPGLYIVRLRLIGDSGVLDVSYCYGRLKDGTLCRVELPFDQIPLRGHKRVIVQWAKKEKVFAQGLGIFDNISILH